MTSKTSMSRCSFPQRHSRSGAGGMASRRCRRRARCGMAALLPQLGYQAASRLTLAGRERSTLTTPARSRTTATEPGAARGANSRRLASNEDRARRPVPVEEIGSQERPRSWLGTSSSAAHGMADTAGPFPVWRTRPVSSILAMRKTLRPVSDSITSPAVRLDRTACSTGPPGICA